MTFVCNKYEVYYCRLYADEYKVDGGGDAFVGLIWVRTMEIVLLWISLVQWLKWPKRACEIPRLHPRPLNRSTYHMTEEAPPEGCVRTAVDLQFEHGILTIDTLDATSSKLGGLLNAIVKPQQLVVEQHMLPAVINVSCWSLGEPVWMRFEHWGGCSIDVICTCLLHRNNCGSTNVTFLCAVFCKLLNTW